MSTRACPAGRGLGARAARGQDGADVGGPPAAELHGPAQGGQQGFGAVRRVQGGDVGQLGGQLRHPGPGSPDQERLRNRSEGEEILLRLGSRPGCPARPVRPGRAVVVIDDAGLTRRDQPMLGQHLPADRLDHGDHRRRGGEGDLVADQPTGHRVASRSEPDTRQPVDLPGDRPGAQLESQRRQRAEHRLFDGQPLSRHRIDLRMSDRVDLGAPHGCRLVGRSMIIEGLLRDHQVSLGIADQMLHHALRLRVRRFTEIGPKPVVGGETDIVRGWHHHVGHDPRFQAAHPVGQHHLRHPAEGFEALRQQSERGGSLLIGGEPDEPEP